ncbi:MAG: hypothetical protein KF887_03690 [Paracoccaceae bacterium]|nr:MAG: hypothetical protein KF887_03690 [Paracoccaceae bacterium]
MIQAVAIFLLGMGALAVWSRFRRPPARRGPPRLSAPALCGRCGRLNPPGKACACTGRKG